MADLECLDPVGELVPHTIRREAGQIRGCFLKPCRKPFIAGDKEVTGVKSMHVWGKEDEICPPADSIHLASRYANAETLIHAGGHHVPSRTADARLIRDFLLREDTHGPV